MSGVHFISGKPGGGKSLYATSLCLQELVNGRRGIVTNLALRLPELAEMVQKQAEKQGVELPDLHITERVTIIEEEDLKEFYRFRPGGVYLPVVEEKLQSTSKGLECSRKADFSAVKDEGCLYVLDEIHVAFNARAWASTGMGVLYYLSQHRKLGDEVILITQSVNNVDRQMRSVAQDYTYVRNFRKEKAGMFKLPGVFMKRVFLEPAGPSSKPCESGMFRLDLGVANCFDTACGVGIQGRSGADIKERVKGLPWWVFIILMVASIIALVHYAPILINWLVTPHGGKPKPAAVVPAVPARSVPSPAVRPVIDYGVTVPAAAARAVSASLQGLPEAHKGKVLEVSCSGYAMRLDKQSVWVFYDDGSSEIVLKGDIALDGKNIFVNGKRYALKN